MLLWQSTHLLRNREGKRVHVGHCNSKFSTGHLSIEGSLQMLRKPYFARIVADASPEFEKQIALNHLHGGAVC